MASKVKYQYDTSPRKINEPIKKKKPTINKNEIEQNKPVQKLETKKNVKVKTIVYLIVLFAVVFGIGYRNTQIDEGFVKLQGLKSELAAIQKENEQLRVSIENGLNLSTVEDVAKETLGMRKLDNNQKIYINLPKRDYIEPAAEKVIIEEKNWFDNIIKLIMNLF